MHRSWKSMDDEQFKQYGKDNGLFGLTSSEANKKDGAYYNEALTRGLVDAIFTRNRRWLEGLDKEQFIQYGKDNGLFGLGLKEAADKDRSYYDAARRRKLAGVVFTKKIRSWRGVDNEQFIQYGKDHGLFGLSPSEANEKDATYYNQSRKRKLVDTIFDRRLERFTGLTNEQFIQYGRDNGLFGLSPTEADEKTFDKAVNDLLEEGTCYEPRPGQLKKC